MDSATTQNVPEAYREIYKRHWKTIKPSIKIGLIKDVYHFPLFSGNYSEIVAHIKGTLGKYKNIIKINIGFGFILRNRTTDDLKFFHPSNNTMIFEVPRLIGMFDDVNDLLKDVENDDIVQYVRSQRPSTNWKVLT